MHTIANGTSSCSWAAADAYHSSATAAVDPNNGLHDKYPHAEQIAHYTPITVSGYLAANIEQTATPANCTVTVEPSPHQSLSVTATAGPGPAANDPCDDADRLAGLAIRLLRSGAP